MYKKLKIVKINSKYCDYLRTFDNKVPYNAGLKELRPFIGILFTIDKCEYFAPLSSPKPKHKQLKNTIDLIKINNGTYGVINFNNMIPVTQSNYEEFNLNKKCNDEKEKKRIIERENFSKTFQKSEPEFTNWDYLEIVSGFSAFGSIRKVFPEHPRVLLSLSLHFGDISDIYKQNRSWLVRNECDFKIFESFQKLEFFLEKVKRVRIWSSHISSNEFLLFCFLCDFIKDKEISVCFADEYLPEVWSIGCMWEKEVKELSYKEHRLTPDEILKYQMIWEKVYFENSDLRFLKNGEVISVSFDFFTDMLIELVSKFQEISVKYFVGILMGEHFIEEYGDFEYCYLIKRLIQKGVFQIVKDGSSFDTVKYFGADNFFHSIICVKNA